MIKQNSNPEVSFIFFRSVNAKVIQYESPRPAIRMWHLQ